MDTPSLCPCGSEKPYANCCGALHQGAPAPSAEALMRSRYSANVLGDDAYLARSWHPSTHPVELDSRAGPRWVGLEIVATDAGGAGDTEGMVEFKAYYLDGNKLSALHEQSRFLHEEGRWLYVNGRIYPSQSRDIGRNEACPCGSGKKFKRCCGG